MTRLLPVTEPVASLDNYLAIGGGVGLTLARSRGTDWARAQIEAAGLAVAPRSAYVVVDVADDEPGTFKNRYIVRRNPYQVLEGLAIAAMCGHAERAVVMIERESEQELVALITAADELSGRLGVPVQFVLGRDENLPGTRIDVETLAHLPEILRLGPDWFRYEETTVFTISGDVRRPSVVELPLGFPVRALIDLIGGGVPDGRRVKAVFPGPLTADHLDSPQSTTSFVVYDDSACIVAATLAFSRFHGAESVACLERIERGKGSARDLAKVSETSNAITTFSDEFEAHLGRRCPSPRDLPVPRFLDYDEESCQFTYDDRSDWTGTTADTVVPLPSREVTVSSPPISSARSVMLTRP